MKQSAAGVIFVMIALYIGITLMFWCTKWNPF